jgi:hypothetical protein
MVYFVFDSNLVRTNTSWVSCFSSTPKIGHCSYISGVNRELISLFVARSTILPKWDMADNVYLKPIGSK